MYIQTNTSALKRGPCPFFERCPAFRQLGAHHHHFDIPEEFRFEDNLSVLHAFDFIAHFWGLTDFTHKLNEYRLKLAVIEKIRNQCQ